MRQADKEVTKLKVQSSRAIAYMFRNIIPLLMFAIIPALLLGFFGGDARAVVFADTVAKMWANGGVVTDVTLGASMLENFTIVRFFNFEGLLALLGFVTYIFATGFILAMVERHMRLGVRFSRTVIINAFSVLLRVGAFLLLLFVLDELFLMIVVGLVSMIESIGASVRFVVACSLVLLVVAKLLYFSIVGLLLCSLPVSQCDDYKLNVAMSYSARLMARRNNVVLSLVAMLFISNVVAFALSYFLSEIAFLGDVVYCLYYLFWTMYLPCLSVKVYFEVADEPRKDLEKQIF